MRGQPLNTYYVTKDDCYAQELYAKIITFQKEIVWKLIKCSSLGSIQGRRYNGMVFLSFLFLLISLSPFDPGAS